MSNFVWCHGPSCHKSHTQDRIRGVKDSKVLRTKKVAQDRWNSGIDNEGNDSGFKDIEHISKDNGNELI